MVRGILGNWGGLSTGADWGSGGVCDRSSRRPSCSHRSPTWRRIN